MPSHLSRSQSLPEHTTQLPEHSTQVPVCERINVRSTVLRSFAHSRALATMQPRVISLRCNRLRSDARQRNLLGH